MTDDPFQSLSAQMATLVEGQHRLERITADFAARTEERFRGLEERRFAQMDGRLTRFQAETMRRFTGVDRRLDRLEAKVA